MRILMRRNTIVAGEHRSIGDVVEVDDRIGEALIFMKKAVLAPESEAKDETGGNTDENGDESGVEAAVVGPEEQAVQPKAKRK